MIEIIQSRLKKALSILTTLTSSTDNISSYISKISPKNPPTNLMQQVQSYDDTLNLNNVRIYNVGFLNNGSHVGTVEMTVNGVKTLFYTGSYGSNSNVVRTFLRGVPFDASTFTIRSTTGSGWICEYVQL